MRLTDEHLQRIRENTCDCGKCHGKTVHELLGHIDSLSASAQNGIFEFPIEGERELTRDERFRWGECPVCAAPHGESCYADVGSQLGHRVDGRPMRDGEGAHLGRLQAAPKSVRLKFGH